MAQTDFQKKFAAMRKDYGDRLPAKLADLQRAFQNQDWVSVQQQAHTIGGSAGCFGWEEVGKQLRTLEQVVKAGQIDRARSILERVVGLAARGEPS